MFCDFCLNRLNGTFIRDSALLNELFSGWPACTNLPLIHSLYMGRKRNEYDLILRNYERDKIDIESVQYTEDF